MASDLVSGAFGDSDEKCRSLSIFVVIKLLDVCYGLVCCSSDFR